MTGADIYKHLADTLNTAVVVVTPELLIDYINPSAEALLAVSKDSVSKHPFSELFRDADSITEALVSAVSANHHFTSRRTRLTLAGGSKITVDYSVTPLGGDNGLLIEVQPLDRLLRISREERLISSQATTRNLVRGMAHEIKNPLGGIRGAAQLLARELPSPELEEYTNIIIDEADRLRNLVDRMLGPHQMPDVQTLNIHQVLERVATIISAETPSLPLIRDYDPSIPDIEGDQELLIQAVLNITRNAMQALTSPEQANDAQLTLRTRIQRHFTIGKTHHALICRLDVIDNGPGIPEELIGNIFYPMISGRAEGTGLGLSISQTLITQHQGLVECESQPGNTQFSIYLPLTQDTTS